MVKNKRNKNAVRTGTMTTRAKAARKTAQTAEDAAKAKWKKAITVAERAYWRGYVVAQARAKAEARAGGGGGARHFRG